MTEILIAIAIGIVLGCADVLNYKAKMFASKLSKVSLFVMLWCLAAKVGCDPNVLKDLGRLGWQSAMMAVAMAVGSFGVVWVFSHFFGGSIEAIKELENHK